VTDHHPVSATAVTSSPPVLASHDEAMEAARALGPRLRGRIAEAEQLRRLPDETVADLLEGGLCGVMKPRRFGGSELGAETLVDVSVELAAQCASSGWVYMLWAAHMWLLALWPAAAQEEMFADPAMVASSVVSTAGTVERVAGGYRWTGKGFFSSGVDHCQWLTAAVTVRDEDTGAEGRKWFLIPRADFEIIDDWHVIGLRGTGSKTLTVTDAFIPLGRVLDDADIQRGTAPGREVNPHPMYGAISQANFTAAMAAPAIGAARGLLDAYGDKLRRKAASAAAGATVSMARYAAAAAQLDAVHALTVANTRRYATAPAAAVGPEGRAKCKRDYAYAAQESRKAANTIYAECGGSGLAETSDLQRIWRDANAAAAHHGLTWDWQADLWTRAAFGLPVAGVNA
jgi:3-hydroxy-9,10-secoandrosta-1,3,5(10)-triene-9,17-dione monooxygenase